METMAHSNLNEVSEILIGAFAAVAALNGEIKWDDFTRECGRLRREQHLVIPNLIHWELEELTAAGYISGTQTDKRITAAGRRYVALGGRECLAAALAAQPRPRRRASALAELPTDA